MKSSKNILVSFFIFPTVLCIVIVILSSVVTANNTIDAGRAAISEVIPNELRYVGQVDKDEAQVLGDYKYEDDEYEYYWNSNEGYISTVYCKKESVFDLSISEISPNAAASIAKKIFYKYNKSMITGELLTNIKKLENVGYLCEVVEILGEFETGSKASIMLSQSGEFLNGGFLTCDLITFNKIKNLEKVSKNDAEAIASFAVSVLADKENNYNVSGTSIASTTKTYKNSVYWIITIPVNVNVSFNSAAESQVVQVMVNAFSGEVMAIITEQ